MVNDRLISLALTDAHVALPDNAITVPEIPGAGNTG